MLSIRDCLDYCDLTDEEVLLIAEHEDIPDAAAAQLCCGLVQTPEGHGAHSLHARSHRACQPPAETCARPSWRLRSASAS